MEKQKVQKVMQTKYNKDLTLYFPMFPSEPTENIRKCLFFCCFQGDQKGTLGRKVLKSSCKV